MKCQVIATYPTKPNTLPRGTPGPIADFLAENGIRQCHGSRSKWSVSVEHGQEPNANPPFALGGEHWHYQLAMVSGVLEFQDNAQSSPVPKPYTGCASELLQMKRSREDWITENTQKKGEYWLAPCDTWTLTSEYDTFWHPTRGMCAPGIKI